MEIFILWVALQIPRKNRNSILYCSYRDMSHLYALLQCCKEAGIPNVYIHGILDGEDAPNGKYNIYPIWNS